jgi:hypothetical protein
MRLRFFRVEPDEPVMEAAYSGEAGMPPSHLHLSQSERL